MNRTLYLLALLLIVTLLPGCISYSNKAILRSIDPKNVKSLQVVGGLPGTQSSPLYLGNNEDGGKKIRKITGWINTAIPINGQTTYGKHGYSKEINIIMKNGKLITVEPAYDCIIHSSTSYSTKVCKPIKNEIVITINKHILRARSSELSGWL